MFSSKGQEGAHHAGFEGGNCKKRERMVSSVFGMSDCDVWDSHHIEGYLSGSMYKFVYMIYVQ